MTRDTTFNVGCGHQALVDGKVVAASWNSKGAALAGLDVEKKRLTALTHRLEQKSNYDLHAIMKNGMTERQRDIAATILVKRTKAE